MVSIMESPFLTSFKIKRFFRKNESGQWYFVWNALAIDREAKILEEKYITIGDKFLSEGNHDEAINYYKKAIAVEVESDTSYLRLCKAYSTLRQFQLVVQVAQDCLSKHPNSEGAYIMLASASRMNNEYEKAHQYLRKTLQINPLSIKSFEELSHLYMAVGKFDNALVAIKKAIKLNKDATVEYYYTLGNIYLAMQDYESAVNAYSRVEEKKTRDAELYNKIGYCHLMLNRFTPAKMAFQKALEFQPNNIEVLYNLGLTAQHEHQYNDAIKWFSQAKAIMPLHKDVCFRIASTYAQMGKHTQASAELIKLIELEPNQPKEILHYAADLFVRTNYTNEAIRAYQILLKSDNLNTDYISKVGLLYIELDEYSKAEEEFRRVLHINPSFALAHHGMGLCNMKSENYDTAILEFQNALAINELYIESYSALAQCYSAIHEPNLALQNILKAIAISPKNPDSYFIMAEIQESIGYTNEAIDSYTNAIRYKPTHLSSYLNRGKLFMKQGEYAKAIQSFRQVLKIDPSSADAHYQTAITHLAIGRIPQAIEHFQEAINLKPDHKEQYISFGMALERAFQTDKAIETYRQAIQIFPDYADAYYHLGRVCYEQGLIAQTMDIQQKLDSISQEHALKLRMFREQAQSMSA